MNYEELMAKYLRLKEHAAQLETDNLQLREQLNEAKLLIAQLRRELFGPKADKLSPEQEEQLKMLNKDLEADAQSPPPVSDQILDQEEAASRRKQKPKRQQHPIPDHLETETVTIEPEEKICPCCGKPLEQIGEEVTEERAPKVCMPLRGSRRCHCSLTGAADSAKQAWIGTGGAYPPFAV
jgi:transposase